MPADADAETHPSVRERVERADLFGDKRRLALWQNKHFRPETDPIGDGGGVSQHHECFENRHLRRIVGLRASGHVVVSHDHMIVDVELVVADVLDALGEPGDSVRAFAIGDAGEFDG